VKDYFFRHNIFGAWVDDSREALPNMGGELQHMRCLFFFRYGLSTTVSDLCSGLLVIFTNAGLRTDVAVGTGSLGELVEKMCRQTMDLPEYVREHPQERLQRIQPVTTKLKGDLEEEIRLTRKILDCLELGITKA